MPAPTLGRWSLQHILFAFSHDMDIGEVNAVMGHCVALADNVHPLDAGVRGTPAEARDGVHSCLDKVASGGGVIPSFGPGASPAARPENVATYQGTDSD